MRKIRGTKLDLFGMTAERRMERALIGEFECTVGQLLDKLGPENVGEAAAIVREYLEIRGYGPVKEAVADEVRKRIAERLEGFGQQRDKAA